MLITTVMIQCNLRYVCKIRGRGGKGPGSKVEPSGRADDDAVAGNDFPEKIATGSEDERARAKMRTDVVRCRYDTDTYK